MSPRLQQLTEQRAGRALLWMVFFIIVTVHAAGFTAWLFNRGSVWSVPLAAVALYSARLSYKAFRQSNKHLDSLLK